MRTSPYRASSWGPSFGLLLEDLNDPALYAPARVALTRRDGSGEDRRPLRRRRRGRAPRRAH